MSAVETLSAAQAAGVRVGLDGTDLLIEADCAPPPELLDALGRDKSEILALLRTRNRGEIRSPITTTELPNLHGLTFAELEEAAGEDWPEVRDAPAVLEALAHAVVTRRQREWGECPPHTGPSVASARAVVLSSSGPAVRRGCSVAPGASTAPRGARYRGPWP